MRFYWMTGTIITDCIGFSWYVIQLLGICDTVSLGLTRKLIPLQMLKTVPDKDVYAWTHGLESVRTWNGCIDSCAKGAK